MPTQNKINVIHWLVGPFCHPVWNDKVSGINEETCIFKLTDTYSDINGQVPIPHASVIMSHVTNLMVCNFRSYSLPWEWKQMKIKN